MADRSGRAAVDIEPLAAARSGTGLAERLVAVVRVEFRSRVLVPAVGDPILGLAGLRGTRLRALQSVRRAVPGASRAGGERLVVRIGRRGRRRRILRWSVIGRCDRAWCPSARSVSTGMACATAIPAPGTRPAARRWMSASCRWLTAPKSGVRDSGMRVVGGARRGLVPIPTTPGGGNNVTAGGGVHRLLRQLRRGPL